MQLQQTSKLQERIIKPKERGLRLRQTWPFLVMLLPGFAFLIVYQYLPMAGLSIAFMDFKPLMGFAKSKWIGWDNYRYILEMPNIGRVIWNTFYIAILKVVGGLIVPVTVAILLNEVSKVFFKRTMQTLVYIPHFFSWAILGGILIDILSPSYGIANQIIQAIGLQPIPFLASNDWFPYTLVISDIWKEFGFGTIIYLAALTNIDPALYESAVMDGANCWKKTWHITLPGMRPIIVLMATLSLGQIMNAGFEQVFALYSPIVYQSGDIIDTLSYRVGLEQAQYSLATAISMFKSIISFFLICIGYYIAYRIANYRIF